MQTHGAGGRTREGLGAGVGFFLLSSLSFLSLTPPPPLPPDPADGIKGKDCACLSQAGDFLRVLCVVLFEKGTKPPNKHSFVLTQKSNSTVEISLSVPRGRFPK